MPPAPKADINRAGAESTDFPSVCESCLPVNPYVQMIRENYGAECKLCTRPYTVFRWAPDRTSRYKKTNICLTCARLKNCCQCCMLDLSFGLPIVVRDAALKLAAQGPGSNINKQYFAQNHEGQMTEGMIPEEYEKTDEKARELLKRLATSEPYHKRKRQPTEDGDQRTGPGPVRTARGGDRGRGGAGGRGGRGGGGGGGGGGRGARFPSASQLPPGPQDILPPEDPSITSLFLLGVEDDLPEHAIRTFFSPFGALRSVICVHHSHCAFVNFQTRAGAEAAAESCQGKAVIAGCPLRIQWGKPRPLGGENRDEQNKQAREAKKAVVQEMRLGATDGEAAEKPAQTFHAVAPPGMDDVRYPSQKSY